MPFSLVSHIGTLLQLHRKVIKSRRILQLHVHLEGFPRDLATSQHKQVLSPESVRPHNGRIPPDKRICHSTPGLEKHSVSVGRRLIILAAAEELYVAEGVRGVLIFDPPTRLMRV